MGYRGRIVPIHPKAAEVEGLRTSPSLAALSEPADFAYVAIGADAALEALDAAPGKARFVQVMSSGFGETPAGIAKEKLLVEAAQRGGFRLIGPNCLGVHSPRGGITFVGGADPTPGGVGVISQSGGLAVDVILRGRERGLKFSAVTTLGNSADLKPVDLLEFHIADPATKVIGLYLEDVREGRRFVQRLVEYGARKPIVMLIGGRTEAGGRAAASHTGSLAADARLWSGIANQSGAAIVDTLDDFLNALLVMQAREEARGRPIRNVALFGNGGGSSVLAADAFARAGLDVPPFGPRTLARLEALGLPPGTGLANPVDTPAGTLRHREGAVAGEILDILVEETGIDFIVVHVNLPVFTTSINQTLDVIGGLVREATRVKQEIESAPPIALVLRSDGAEATERRRRDDRRKALDAGIPVFDELAESARAIGALAHWEACVAKMQA
jgi:acyl-CoA synthetase (NDP forming)